MPQAATQTKDTAVAPVAPRMTRGLREGEIRTRAAANGAPASTTYDVEARTFDFTLLTSRSCNSYRYVLTEGDRWPAYTREATQRRHRHPAGTSPAGRPHPVTSVLALVLARTLAASSVAEACVLETAAHGTVVTRGGFTRAEVVRDRGNGEIPMLDADTRLVIEEASAPGVEIGDLVHVDGRLWQVRAPLANAGSVTLQLVAAQRADITVDDEAVAAHVIGEPGDGKLLVALAAAGVLRRSDLVEVDGTRYRVGTPTVWPAGDLRRYVFTPA